MILAIDTGGTKTLVASFRRNGNPDKTFKFATPKEPIAYIDTLSRVIKDNYSLAQISVVILAVPGIVKNNIAEWCSNLGWKHFDIANSLREHGISAPIFLENDANLAGLGEVRRLHRLPESALYLTISTGIGSSLIIKGRLSESLNSEAGHSVVCHHGTYREWEKFASGRAIVEEYGSFARDIPDTDTKTWQEIAEKISSGLLVLIPTLLPEVIIIGGSIGTYFARYATFLSDILLSQLDEHLPKPHIIQAHYPEEAVIYGCYCYGSDKLFS